MTRSMYFKLNGHGYSIVKNMSKGTYSFKKDGNPIEKDEFIGAYRQHRAA